MTEDDKKVFILSALAGFFGAMLLAIKGEMSRAQTQQDRAVDDDRIRFEIKQNEQHAQHGKNERDSEAE